MKDGKPINSLEATALGAEPDDGDRLLERYGGALSDRRLSEAQEKEALLALWRIMQGFVELGFSIKAGDKFTQNAALGMDDMIDYLFSSHTATEDPSSNIDK